MANEQRIREINRELETGYLKPERVVALLAELKKLSYYK